MRQTLITFLVVAICAVVAQAQPASFDDLGVIGGPGVYSFDTVGSFNITGGFDLDTEIGLYDAAGNVLAADDDGLGFPYSIVTEPLGPGDYYVGISEFDSIWDPNFVNSGTQFEAGESGEAVLNIDSVFAGSQIIGEDVGLDETGWWKVSIVPEPSAFAMLALAMLGFIGFRRR